MWALAGEDTCLENGRFVYLGVQCMSFDGAVRAGDPEVASVVVRQGLAGDIDAPKGHGRSRPDPKALG